MKYWVSVPRSDARVLREYKTRCNRPGGLKLWSVVLYSWLDVTKARWSFVMICFAGPIRQLRGRGLHPSAGEAPPLVAPSDFFWGVMPVHLGHAS